MSGLSDRISYLRGLAEGLHIETDSNEGKLISQLIEVLSEAIDEIDELHEELDELNEYVEGIDDDLSELEGDFGDDEDWDEEDDEDDEDDDDLVTRLLDDDDDDEDEDDENVSMYVGCICPKCNGMFCVDANDDEDDQVYVCPHCRETVAAQPMDNDNVPIAKAFIDEGDED